MREKQENSTAQAPKEKRAWRLYAARNDEAGMRAILAQRFHRVTPGYGLIYTDGPQPAGTIEVSGEDLNRLTDADRAWLFSCNVSIIAKAAAESAEETKKRMGELMDMVEAELKTVRKEDKANG